MDSFSFKRVAAGKTLCYTVCGADRTVIGQVRKKQSSRLWVAEGVEDTKRFSILADAVLWLVGVHGLHTPLADRMLAFDPTPSALIGAPLRKIHKSLWARLRQEHFKDGNLSCDICKTIESEARLIHAHEVYSFPTPEIIRLDCEFRFNPAMDSDLMPAAIPN